MRYQHHPIPSTIECIALPALPPTIHLLNEEGELKTIEEVVEDTIRFHIEHHDGCLSSSSRSLGISRSTLYRKIYASMKRSRAPQIYIG
jgi:transcriptional regulator of acetoin/glycerol metabolism